jgi:lysylphosphatidylglycerol synthetase-like protein (DUF2156 family)
MTPDRWQGAVGYAAVFVVLAAFPRLGYPLRWRTRLSPSRVVAYIAVNTAMGFALQVWVLPYLRRMAQKSAQAEEELRQQLGRKPTGDELLEHLGIAGTPRTGPVL